MDVDVYISHCAEDRIPAERVCASLEASGIRSFLDPRDVNPDADRMTQIASAIAASRCFVLVHSWQAAASRQIKRELELAVAGNAVTYLVKTDEAAPDGQIRRAIPRGRWFRASEVAEPNNVLVRELGRARAAVDESARPVGEKRRAKTVVISVVLFFVIGTLVRFTFQQVFNALVPPEPPRSPPAVWNPPTLPELKTLQPNVPAPAAAQSHAFRSVAGNFEVSAPVPLTAVPTKYADLPFGRVALHGYEGMDEREDMLYMAFYYIIPPGQGFSLDGAVQGMAGGGRLTRAAEDSMGGVTGRQFTIIKSEAGVQVALDGRIFRVGDHVIGVMAGRASQSGMRGARGVAQGYDFVHSLNFLSNQAAQASPEPVAPGTQISPALEPVEFKYLPGGFAVTAPIPLKVAPAAKMDLPKSAGRVDVHQFDAVDENTHAIYSVLSCLYPASVVELSIDDMLKKMAVDGLLTRVSEITQDGHTGKTFTITPSAADDDLATTGRMFLTQDDLVWVTVKWHMGSPAAPAPPQTNKFLDSLRFVSRTGGP